MHESPAELQVDCVFLYELSRFRVFVIILVMAESILSVEFCDSGVQFLHQFRQPKKTGRNVKTKRRPQKNARSKKFRSSQPLRVRIGGRFN
jgi:hypothetical protein